MDQESYRQNPGSKRTPVNKNSAPAAAMVPAGLSELVSDEKKKDWLWVLAAFMYWEEKRQEQQGVDEQHQARDFKAYLQDLEQDEDEKNKIKGRQQEIQEKQIAGYEKELQKIAAVQLKEVKKEKVSIGGKDYELSCQSLSAESGRQLVMAYLQKYGREQAAQVVLNKESIGEDERAFIGGVLAQSNRCGMKAPKVYKISAHGEVEITAQEMGVDNWDCLFLMRWQDRVSPMAVQGMVRALELMKSQSDEMGEVSVVWQELMDEYQKTPGLDVKDRTKAESRLQGMLKKLVSDRSHGLAEEGLLVTSSKPEEPVVSKEDQAGIRSDSVAPNKEDLEGESRISDSPVVSSDSDVNASKSSFFWDLTRLFASGMSTQEGGVLVGLVSLVVASLATMVHFVYEKIFGNRAPSEENTPVEVDPSGPAPTRAGAIGRHSNSTPLMARTHPDGAMGSPLKASTNSDDDAKDAPHPHPSG